MAAEERLLHLITQHLVIVIPVAILLLRMAVRWVARETAKEVFSSLLTVPLDLMYISMALVLQGVARLIPKFVEKYGSDTKADLAGLLVMVGVFILAALLTWLGRGVRVLWQKFYAAAQQVRERIRQPDFKWGDGEMYVGGRLLWMLGYWVLMILIYFIQLVIAIGCLWYVLKIVE